MIQYTIDQFTISQLEDCIVSLVRKLLKETPKPLKKGTNHQVLNLNWDLYNMYPGIYIHNFHFKHHKLYITYTNIYGTQITKPLRSTFERRTLFNIFLLLDFISGSWN